MSYSDSLRRETYEQKLSKTDGLITKKVYINGKIEVLSKLYAFHQ